MKQKVKKLLQLQCKVIRAYVRTFHYYGSPLTWNLHHDIVRSTSGGRKMFPNCCLYLDLYSKISRIFILTNLFSKCWICWFKIHIELIFQTANDDLLTKDHINFITVHCCSCIFYNVSGYADDNAALCSNMFASCTVIHAPHLHYWSYAVIPA